MGKMKELFTIQQDGLEQIRKAEEDYEKLQLIEDNNPWHECTCQCPECTAAHGKKMEEAVTCAICQQPIYEEPYTIEWGGITEPTHEACHNYVQSLLATINRFYVGCGRAGKLARYYQEKWYKALKD